MYCPVCFSDTLFVGHRGVVNLIINGKQMDAGRFLFRVEDERRETVKAELKRKLEEFFKWYSNFQNKDPIKKIELFSSDFSCEAGCKMPLNYRQSVVDILITSAELRNMLTEMGAKYKLEIKLDDED